MTFTRVTTDEEDEAEVLSFMTESTYKFVVQVGVNLGARTQAALERLMMRDWIRLIDVSTIQGQFGIYRVFRVEPEAVEWFRAWKARAS
jgi:hypothetical protein